MKKLDLFGLVGLTASFVVAVWPFLGLFRHCIGVSFTGREEVY